MVKNEDYQKMDKDAIQLLIDYEFLEFPIDVFAIAKDKLHAKLIKFSELEVFQQTLLRSNEKTKDGLTIFKKNINVGYDCLIIYNDKVSLKRQRFTIAHEIKHIIYKEINPDQDDEITADHFARVLLLPPCLLIALKNKNPSHIVKLCDVSEPCVSNALEAINNRVQLYFDTLFDYEIPFIAQVKNKESLFRSEILDRCLFLNKR